MACKVNVLASEVWAYFQSCKDELKKHMHQIAGNSDYGVEIFITEDAGLPDIVVTADDVQIYEETAVGEKDCKETVQRIYDKYLTAEVVSVLTDEFDGEELTHAEIDDFIYEREFELDLAVSDFIDIAVGGIVKDTSMFIDDDAVEDIKDHFLEYLYLKHNVPIYRPMVLEYDDGSEEYSEYPYEDMVFDDENNPIYKS